MQVDLINNELLGKNYLETQTKKKLTGHSYNAHPLLKKELENGSQSIINFLNLSILAQARNSRTKLLYQLSADKCYSNSNSYSFSESRECENLLFARDPVLNNIKNFVNHVDISFQDQHEKALNGVTCAKEYYNKHKVQLLKMNFLYRYYYYFLAKDLFLTSK